MILRKTAGVLILFTIILCGALGYFVGINSLKIAPINTESIPQCSSGRCPEYQSLDVNGDSLAESVVIVPTTMTKGAGEVWVISKGKVIFKSDEFPLISVKGLETNNGFIISHGELSNNNETVPDKETKYIYQNGSFSPVPIP